MSFVFGVQLALATVAVSWGFAKLHALLVRSAIDAQLFLDALTDALVPWPTEQGITLALRLIDAAPRSAMARLAREVLTAEPGHQAQVERDLLWGDLQREALAGIASLRTLGRMAPPLAFVGVIVEMGLALQGGEGLAGLQRGLPERLAIEHSATGVVLGLCTSLFCFFVAAQLQRGARKRMTELRLTLDVIEAARQVRAET